MVFIVVYEPMTNAYPDQYAKRTYGPFSDVGTAHTWRNEHLKSVVKWDVVIYLGLDPDEKDRR